MAPKQRARDYVVMWPHCFTGKLDRGPKREKELAQRLVTFFFCLFDHGLGVLLAIAWTAIVSTDSAVK